MLTAIIAGMLHTWATGGSVGGLGIDWAQVTVDPPAVTWHDPDPYQVVSVWPMVSTPSGDWTQIGVLEMPGDAPALFWQDGTDAAPTTLPLPSGPVDLAISCDFGTTTYHDWVDGNLVHTANLDAPCGSSSLRWWYSSETTVGPNETQPSFTVDWQNPFVDFVGAQMPWFYNLTPTFGVGRR